MTTYGCCNIRTWPPRSALQEARNTTADQVHQHQHLCWASIHEECTERHSRPSENGRFFAMLRQVHNMSSILLRDTTERTVWMWKEDTASCQVIVSTCLGGLRKRGVSHRKEIFCAEILRPFGFSETHNRNCVNVMLDIAGILAFMTFWSSVVWTRSKVRSQRQRNLAESLKLWICIRKIPGSRLVPYTTIRNKKN